MYMCCTNLPQFLVKCCRHLENFHLYREDPGNYAQGSLKDAHAHIETTAGNIWLTKQHGGRTGVFLVI